MTDHRTVSTPHGEATLHIDRSRHPIATLVLGHGAASGSTDRDLTVLSLALPRQGVSVFRLDQPWRVAGRRVAPSPKILDEGWVAALDSLRPQTPLVVGGRSAGARVACRTARRLGASGCLALAFPLHPPGRPEKSRVEELLGSGVTTLVVQGDRDPFGRPEEFPDGVDLAVVPGADHSFRVPKSNVLNQEEALAVLLEAVLEWITREVA